MPQIWSALINAGLGNVTILLGTQKHETNTTQLSVKVHVCPVLWKIYTTVMDNSVWEKIEVGHIFPIVNWISFILIPEGKEVYQM